jgi:type I restriction enzyme S subunit
MSDREKDGGPPGWKRTTLGETLPIRYGKARNEKYGTVREDTPVYGSSGRIDTFDRALTGGPSLIIGRKGTVGATYYCFEPCWPIDTVYFTESPADEDLRFFKYLLDHLQLARMDRSTAVPGLSRDDYNATDVFIPELDQQRLIVAEIEKHFSRLDEAVATLKRVKANLKRYKAAVLKGAVEGKLTEAWRKQHPNVEPASKLLERILAERRKKWTGRGEYKEPAALEAGNLTLPKRWTWATVDQLSVVVRGASPRPAGDPRYFGGTIPWITVGPITADQKPYLTSVPETVTEAGRERSRYLEPHTLLLTNSGATLGVPKITLIGGCINDGVAALLDVVYPLKLYLLYFLHTQTTRLRRVNQGAAQPNLNTSIIKAINVPLPPHDEQEQIVAEVERRLSVIEELEAVVEANLTRAGRLQQSILQQAFDGNLIG